jgi:hypothetical protein
MTTEIALPDTHTSLIQQTAGELEAAWRIAEVLCKTSFAPTHFRGKPEEAAVAVLYGQTIGFDPMTSIQQLYVIGGKPALYTRAMVAIVLAAGHEMWTETSTDEKVVVCGRRRGSEHTERAEWTVDRAKLAGYLSNKKYQTDPQAMLYARASGDVARKVAPDALLGMAYTVEEMEASQPDADGVHSITTARAPREQTRARPRTIVEAVGPTNVPDVDTLLAQAENAPDKEMCQQLWRDTAVLPADDRDMVRTVITARAAELDQPQDAEVVEVPLDRSDEVAMLGDAS